MNNYDKMRRSNIKIKKWLIDNLFENIHFFPHTRFIKDVTIDKLSFDGISTKNNLLVLFQCKTNEKPTKKLIENYRLLNKRYNVRCLFLVNFDRKGVTCFE